MKTGLFIGVPVAAALIGVAWLMGWPVREVPSVAAAWPHGEEARKSAVAQTSGSAATRTHPLAASTAADEEKVFLLGEQVRQALASDDPAIRAGILRRGLRSWVRADAEGAARFAQTIADGPLREQVLRVVAQTWSKHAPEKAAAWAAALPDEIERRIFLGAVCLGLGGVDPVAGVQLADRLGLRDDGVLENLTAQWAAKDEGTALTWVAQRPAGLERDRLMQRIAFAEAQTDPDRAARLVVEQIPVGTEQTEAVISVVNQWAQRDPAAASAWVANFPVGVMRERALGELRGLMARR